MNNIVIACETLKDELEEAIKLTGCKLPVIWIDSSKGLMAEYTRAVERYGEEKAERIFKLMLKSYKYLMLIDTDSYNIDEYVFPAKDVADLTHLELIIEQGGTWLLEKLLTGPYDRDFCIIPKGEEVKICHFGYEDAQAPNQAMDFFNP